MNALKSKVLMRWDSHNLVTTLLQSCTILMVHILCCTAHKTKGRGQGTRLTGHNTFIKPPFFLYLFACQHHSLLHHKYEAQFNVNASSSARSSAHIGLISVSGPPPQNHPSKLCEHQHQRNRLQRHISNHNHISNQRTNIINKSSRKERERYLKRNP